MRSHLGLLEPMEVKNQYFTQRIKFNMMNATARMSEQLLQKQDLSSTYYYVYSYINVIDISDRNLNIAMPAFVY